MFDKSNPLNTLIMKYINSCGTLCVSSERDCEFVNFMSAVMAMNAVQLFFTYHGFYVSSSVYEKTNHIEVSVHFDTFDMPVLPVGYLYSKREVTSSSFTGYTAKPGERCRVVTYFFKF